jgi:hypothetical protein
MRFRFGTTELDSGTKRRAIPGKSKDFKQDNGTQHRNSPRKLPCIVLNNIKR